MRACFLRLSHPVAADSQYLGDLDAIKADVAKVAAQASAKKKA